MSKYSFLWEYVSAQAAKSFSLSFEETEKLLGFPVDHSFLTYKKELLVFGWKVDKISMKNKRIYFNPIL